MLRSTYLGLLAASAILALSGGASAQSAPSTSAAVTPAAPSEAASPMSSHRVPGTTAQQRVEEYIKRLYAQLQITPAEQPQWDKFANVMRENARVMDREFAKRMQQFPTMNAVQNMESYQHIADTHSQNLQKVAPAFAQLYNTMPEQQQRLTDQVFRANTEKKAQKRMQTGRNTLAR